MRCQNKGEGGSTQVIVVHPVRCYTCADSINQSSKRGSYSGVSNPSCDLSADFCDLQLSRWWSGP